MYRNDRITTKKVHELPSDHLPIIITLNRAFEKSENRITTNTFINWPNEKITKDINKAVQPNPNITTILEPY